jgi:methyl-accepting chemotaxis protein
MPERRSHFLINKPLQIRYMAYLTMTLLIVSGAIILSLYFGIWGGLLDAFSDVQIRNELLVASRISEYEDARVSSRNVSPTSITFFKQSEKLSQRQQEVFKGILDQTNRELVPKFILLLFLIGWGSIYLSHKVAGPLYRFNKALEDLEKGNFRVRIHLRKFDEGHFLEDRFNQTVEHLDHLFASLKNIVRENESNPERIKNRLKEELAKIQTSADR